MPEGVFTPGCHLAMPVGLLLQLTAPQSALLHSQDATRACKLQIPSLFTHQNLGNHCNPCWTCRTHELYSVLQPVVYRCSTRTLYYSLY